MVDVQSQGPELEPAERGQAAIPFDAGEGTGLELAEAAEPEQADLGQGVPRACRHAQIDAQPLADAASGPGPGEPVSGVLGQRRIGIAFHHPAGLQGPEGLVRRWQAGGLDEEALLDALPAVGLADADLDVVRALGQVPGVQHLVAGLVGA